MVHHPGYDFNDANLPVGAAYWVRLTERFLSADETGAGVRDTTSRFTLTPVFRQESTGFAAGHRRRNSPCTLRSTLLPMHTPSGEPSRP